MDALELELARLQRDATLSQSIEDVDKILAQLLEARESIATGRTYDRSPRFICVDLIPDPNSASITMAKLQNPIKQGFERVTDDLKKVYAGHNKYGKALDRVRLSSGCFNGLF